MAPIKLKSKGIVKSFQQGQMAEPLIHENVVAFIKTHSREMITVVQAFNVGLVKSCDDHVSGAVFPNADPAALTPLLMMRPDRDKRQEKKQQPDMTSKESRTVYSRKTLPFIDKSFFVKPT
jgi:hypothetical protein